MIEVAAVGGLVVAAAALVVSLFALRWARRAARASERSADAAMSSETARAEAAAEAAVRWSVERRGDQVSMRNLGPRTAYEVTISLSPMSDGGTTPVVLETKPELMVGETYWFDATHHDHVLRPWVQVAWKLEPSDEAWRPPWRVPLPPPPPVPRIY